MITSDVNYSLIHIPVHPLLPFINSITVDFRSITYPSLQQTPAIAISLFFAVLQISKHNQHSLSPGIYVNYDLIKQSMDNIFQNTTLNGSLIEHNALGGVFLGAYCNKSNITVNGTAFVANRQDGLTIESCHSDSSDWFWVEPLDHLKLQPKFFWYKHHWLNKTIHYAHLNISWNLFAR